MSKVIEPSINLRSFNCPQCGAISHQDWFGLGARPLKDGDCPRILSPSEVAEFKEELLAKKDQDDPETTIKILEALSVQGLDLNRLDAPMQCNYETGYLHLSRCYSCRKSAIWIRDTLIYPSKQRIGPDANEDLPPDIRMDYDEARSILNDSPRGACALLRLCLQKICLHVGEKGRNINEDIKSLAEKGLPTRIVQAMDVLRVTGNEAVHPGTMDIRDDRRTALQLCELLNLVAQNLISEPKQIENLYSALPETKKRH